MNRVNKAALDIVAIAELLRDPKKLQAIAKELDDKLQSIKKVEASLESHATVKKALSDKEAILNEREGALTRRDTGVKQRELKVETIAKQLNNREAQINIRLEEVKKEDDRINKRIKELKILEGQLAKEKKAIESGKEAVVKLEHAAEELYNKWKTKNDELAKIVNQEA